MRKIAIASEHAGYPLKEFLKPVLAGEGFEVLDLGVDSDQPVDYPLIAEELANTVISEKAEMGILICGTGIGMSIAANKVRGIRAAHCTDLFTAKMTRLHNDANILCLGAWLTGDRISKEIVLTFLNTEFEGGRHIPRIEKITLVEQHNA